MATELYTQGFVYVNGTLLMQEVEYTVDYKTNDNVVVTQALGFAGITPGADQTSISITSAVPRDGMEIDWYGIMAAREPIEVTGWRSGKQLLFKGFVQGINEKHGVNTSSNAGIDIVAGKPTEI